MLTWYNTSPQTIIPLPPHLPQKMQIDLVVLANWVTRILRVSIVLVRGIQPGVVHSSWQVCTLDEEKVPSCWSLSHLAELRIRWAKKLGEGVDHLIGMTKHIGVAISSLP